MAYFPSKGFSKYLLKIHPGVCMWWQILFQKLLFIVKFVLPIWNVHFLCTIIFNILRVSWCAVGHWLHFHCCCYSFAVQSHKVMHSLLSFTALLENVQMSSTVFALSYICFWGKLGSGRGNSKEPWRYWQAGVSWERPIETSAFRMLSAVRRGTHMHSSSGNCKIWKKDKVVVISFQQTGSPGSEVEETFLAAGSKEDLTIIRARTSWVWVWESWLIFLSSSCSARWDGLDWILPCSPGV